MTTTGLSKFAFLRVTLAACVGIPLIIASNALAQNPPPPPPPPTGAGPAPPPTEVERVIVTGSNIPRQKQSDRTRLTPTTGKKSANQGISRPTNFSSTRQP